MHELVGRIRMALEQSDFLARAFPVVFDQRVRDEDVLMHSLGCSIWNTLGHELGYMAIVEAPAPAAAGNDIRSDSVWFCRTTGRPIVLIEFERYDGSVHGKAGLDAKLGNLMESALRWDDRPELLVLSAWSKGVVSAPNTADLAGKLRTGLTNRKGAEITGLDDCVLLFNRFIFEPVVSGSLCLRRMTFQEVA